MTRSPETFADIIPIERLTTGLDIMVPGFGPAEVYAIEFDGWGYMVQYARSVRGGWDDLDSFYVDAGGSVDHAGIGEPRWIRGINAVTAEEWQAKAEAAPVNLLDAVRALTPLPALREADAMEAAE
jgi:hypothetical protein